MTDNSNADGFVRPRILLAEDNILLLQALKTLLADFFDIVCTASDGPEAVAAAIRTRPEAVVLDIGLPLLNGIDAVHQLQKAAPDIKCILLTQYSSRAYVTGAFRAGAFGYVLKQSASSELKSALETVLRGEYFVSAALGGVPGFGEPAVKLTPRQHEILQQLANGKNAKEIAVAGGVSLKTIEFHISTMMDDLGLGTPDEVTRYALQHAKPDL